MNITETLQVYAREATPEDGRWIFVDADPTAGVTVNTTGRTCLLLVDELRKLRAIVNHLLDATEVTNTSMAAAIAAEFAE